MDHIAERERERHHRRPCIVVDQCTDGFHFRVCSGALPPPLLLSLYTAPRVYIYIPTPLYRELFPSRLYIYTDWPIAAAAAAATSTFLFSTP